MQLVGILAIGGSILMQAIYSKDNQTAKSSKDVKNVSPVIPAVGLVVFTAGIAIDLEAGKHLKIRGK